MNSTIRLTLLTVCAGLGAISSATELRLDIRQAKSQQDVYVQTDAAVRQFTANVAELTRTYREKLVRAGRYDRAYPLSFPMTVRLTNGGKALAPAPYGPVADITLVFDAAGTRAFPTAYKDLLQSVFNQAKGTMNVIFGPPAAGGAVLVKNYDADIADRDAVAGGYYLPNNGSNQREIRFPVYTSLEAAAVNFIHTLLLAYQGTTTYGFDAFEEGLVRAATMRIVRTTGSLPATLDAGAAESVLGNTYDVGSFYDWYNQRALGGASFIAPNLRNTPLPAGGSLGGVYLLRYQMAGSAWYKALVENAGFVRELNRRFYANPAMSPNVPLLVSTAQGALDTVKGAANSRLEGLLFADWFKRQFVLETNETRGPKLLLQPVPIPPEPGSDDFGVFDLAVTYFETQAGGNETLLSGRSYPIFWEPTFQRVFTSAQDEVLNIAGAYGSVTPNFPNLFLNAPYRMAVDIPVGDRITRVYLPAGGVASNKNPDGNDFYGTVIGTNLPAGAVLKVRLTVGNAVTTHPVTNGAFGAKIATSAYLGNARLKIEVIRTQNSQDTLLHTRLVNKGPGELGVDVRVGGDVNYSVPGGILKGLNMVGFPADPIASAPSEVLGVPDNQLLLARYDQGQATYDLYPESGPIQSGLGFFLRSETAKPLVIPGRLQPNVAVSVALRQGWNMIANPLNETALPDRVRVVKASEFPKSFVDAKGVDLGVDVFEFVRGNPDPVSGAPEVGAYTAASNFQPGKAYFIRCLAPEGLSLVFFPTTILPGSPKQPPTPPGWRAMAAIVNGAEKTEVFMAQTPTGTTSFDKREDSALPPRVGGLQAFVESGEALYKDVRRIDTGETYRIRIDGLKPYRPYTITFTRESGYLYNFTMRDPLFGVVRPTTFPFSYTFTPRSSTHRLEFLVHGGGK